MYPFGQEFFNQSQCFMVHGNFHVPFWTRVFESISMLQGTLKFPCTLLVKNFLISVNVTGCMEMKFPCISFRYRMFELVSMLQGTWKFPCTLLDKILGIGLNVTRHMEISMEPFGI